MLGCHASLEKDMIIVQQTFQNAMDMCRLPQPVKRGLPAWVAGARA